MVVSEEFWCHLSVIVVVGVFQLPQDVRAMDVAVGSCQQGWYLAQRNHSSSSITDCLQKRRGIHHLGLVAASLSPDLVSIMGLLVRYRWRAGLECIRAGWWWWHAQPPCLSLSKQSTPLLLPWTRVPAEGSWVMDRSGPRVRHSLRSSSYRWETVLGYA